jgi:predicted negative regulator of RcsB-dependent stress response
MENEIIDKKDFSEKISIFFKEKQRVILITFVTIIGIILAFLTSNYYQNMENEEISEKFIKAGIHLSSEEKNKSKNILIEIVNSENKFYSILALNTIIENDLEERSNEILKLFEIVENLKIDKEQLNLIKLKKALYLIKISKNEEGNTLLNEIISENSIWKDAALEISK